MIQQKAMRCCVRVAVCWTFIMALGFAFACRASDLSVPLLLSPTSTVWIIANMTPPTDVSGGAPPPFRPCEIQFFSDNDCRIPHRPISWVSSNGLDKYNDLGLNNVGNLNFGSTSRCATYWQPKEHWKPLTTASLGDTCSVGSGRRLEGW